MNDIIEFLLFTLFIGTVIASAIIIIGLAIMYILNVNWSLEQIIVVGSGLFILAVILNGR